MSQVYLPQPIAVVTQVINELEAQGLLMLFDRDDHVAKRLTGDLIAAGVLQEGSFVEPPVHSQPLDEPLDS